MDKTQQGLNILDSIRSSLGIPKVETQTRLPGPAPTSAFIETTVTPRPVPQANLKPLTPQPKAGIPGRELFDVSPVGKPLYTPLKEQIRQVSAPKQLYTPTQARITPLNLEQPLIKFPLEKIAKPLGQGTDKILSAINFAQKAKGKSTWERALEGVSGAGEILSIPNEVLIQPTWDLTKIGIKAIVQGNVTKDDVKKAYYAVGSEKNTLGDALGLDEKTTNPVVFQAVRLIDFLPELIDIPTTSAIKGGTKFVKYAKEVPTESKAFDDALEQGAKAFEDATGEAVTPEAKEIIKNIRNNPEELANIASTSDNLLIQEARKYKTADEFIKTQGTPLYHGTTYGNKINKFSLDKANFGVGSNVLAQGNKGIYLTDSEPVAKYFSRKANEFSSFKKDPNIEKTLADPYEVMYSENANKYENVLKVVLSPDIRIKELNKYPNIDDIEEIIKSGNYDAVRFPEIPFDNFDFMLSVPKDLKNNFPKETPKTTFVFNLDKIKTKEQLVDIWKQAQKTVTQLPEQTLIQEAKKYKTADEFIKNIGVQRFEEPNVDVSFNKPQGLYTTPANFESPFASLGGKQSFFAIKPNAKVVEVNTTGFAPDPIKRGVDQMATNLVWLRNTYPDIANNIRGKRFNELKEMFKKDFPKTNWDLFTESQDMIEGYAGLLAKKDGIDVIKGVDNNFPQFSEVVIFNKDAVLDENQLRNIFNSSRKSAEGLISPVTKSLEKITLPSATADFRGAIPPSGGIPTFLPEMGKVLPTKERKFPGTVKNAKGTAKEVKGILNDRIDLYSPIKNKDEFARATKFVDENEIDDVIDYIKFTDDPREVSYIGQALMKKLQDTKNFARVIDVLDIVSEQGTRSGQAIQALSVWGRLTPEGALRSANNLVRQYNLDNKLTEGMPGFIKLTESQAKKIQDQANKLARITDEYERLKEASKLQREIADVVPASLGTKIATIQTLAQLLNPKTFIRNVLGNAIFGSIDSLTQSFATPLDLAISLFTKQRTIAPASFKRQFEGGVQGFRKGMQEALEGADTSQLASQFDLPNGSVFDSKVMQGLEKALNVSLRAPDRAFYEATYKDTLEGLMKLNKVDKPTKEMLEIAHYEGMRRTFQDDNRVSRLFTSAKRALNYIGTKDRSFGLGDIILKYPKTPANLLVRALEYTPVGYVRALYELSKPLFKIGTFDQRAFVNNVARATVGTGMINLGLSLGKLGIITPRPDSDKDARAAQDLQGLQAYSFNTSALKRYVLSGFDAEAAKPRVGDQLVSYDWAQPASLPLAMGANMAENENKIKEGTFSERVLLTFGPLAGEIIRSSDTLTEQSLLQGIQRLFGPGGLQQGIIDNLMAVPGSFVPTILNQINQFTDNASRETYSPDLVEASFNQFSARVPILSQTLPQRVDILGRPKERFPNAQNTFFNVFFNPAFVDQIKDDPVLKETIQLYEETGEKGQFPRLVDKSITVNGERKLLSTQELVDYQTNVGQVSDQIMRKAISNEQYQKLPTQEKALFLANILSDVNKTAKVRLFGESMEGLSGRQEMLFANDLDNYLTETLNNKQEQLRKEQLKAQGLGYTKIRLPSIRKPRARALPKPKKLKLKASRIKPIGRKRTKRLQVATLKPRKEKRNTQTA